MRSAASYAPWRNAALERRRKYVPSPEPGLFSIITPVFNTPATFFDILADSIVSQDVEPPSMFEWVVVNNGSFERPTLDRLRRIAELPFVRLVEAGRNLGIAGGTRLALQRARGRYIVPVDHDDYLYPDAMRIMAYYVQQFGYPAFAYSDEDKLDGATFGEAYIKPDWDPVLFTHSCYTSHLGAMDRGIAEMLGVYDDPELDGCTDWDAFFRFMFAGYTPLHVPEVLYSWRKHSQSTAGNIDAKNYIQSSHRKLLNRFRSTQRKSWLYSVDHSPFFRGTPDWRFHRNHVAPTPGICITVIEPTESCIPAAHDKMPGAEGPAACIRRTDSCSKLLHLVLEVYRTGAIVRLAGSDVTMDSQDWYWDTLALLELFPDTVMAGGPLYNSEGACLVSGVYFGFGGGCGMPDRRRTRQDSGYFVQMWKPHSVSAVSAQNSIVDAGFLIDALRAGKIPPETPVGVVGEWLGAVARRWGKRVIYSPFLAGSTCRDWQDSDVGALDTFLLSNHDLIPDTRYYSQHLDLRSEYAYAPADESTRTSHLARIQNKMQFQHANVAQAQGRW